MSSALEFREPKASEQEGISRQRKTERQLVVATQVVNPSTSDTFYIVTSLRQLTYDAATKGLVISTAEPEGDVKELRSQRLTMPTIRSLRPGASLSLRFAFPADVTKLIDIEPGRLITEVWHVTEARQIILRVAFAKRAFRRMPDEIGASLRKSLREWQSVVETPVTSMKT